MHYAEVSYGGERWVVVADPATFCIGPGKIRIRCRANKADISQPETRGVVCIQRNKTWQTYFTRESIAGNLHDSHVLASTPACRCQS